MTQTSKQARAWAMGTEVPTPIPKIAELWQLENIGVLRGRSSS